MSERLRLFIHSDMMNGNTLSYSPYDVKIMHYLTFIIFFFFCYVQTVVFETPVFHPLIDPETLELDIKRGFANKWRRNVNHLWHVLLYVRRCFYKIETTHPLNPEAAVL